MSAARGSAVNEYNRNKTEIADRNTRRSPVYTAAVSGNYKDLMRLIKEGESINARADNNNTPLIAACENRRSIICKVLIENGAEVHVTNKLGKTALHKAVYNGLLPIVKMLLDKGVDLNIQDDVYGNTPLHKACEYDQYEAARLLISKGCDTNLKNKVCGYMIIYTTNRTYLLHALLIVFGLHF